VCFPTHSLLSRTEMAGQKVARTHRDAEPLLEGRVAELFPRGARQRGARRDFRVEARPAYWPAARHAKRLDAAQRLPEVAQPFCPVPSRRSAHILVRGHHPVGVATLCVLQPCRYCRGWSKSVFVRGQREARKRRSGCVCTPCSRYAHSPNARSRE
jgi:hypothetical protein